MQVKARRADSSGKDTLTIDLTGYPPNTFEAMSRLPQRCLVDGQDATATSSGESFYSVTVTKTGITYFVNALSYEQAVPSPYDRDID